MPVMAVAEETTVAVAAEENAAVMTATAAMAREAAPPWVPETTGMSVEEGKTTEAALAEVAAAEEKVRAAVSADASMRR
tara:strand:- start:24 stop:260 length:237 start_codon:yes stop_codon:yes gene_type:complete